MAERYHARTFRSFKTDLISPSSIVNKFYGRLWRKTSRAVSTEKQNRMSPSVINQNLVADVRQFIGNPDPAESEFNRLALDLFEFQFQRVAPYRALCEARNQRPQTIEHWSRIPAVPATAFKEFELTSLARGERTAVFFSSGTCGENPSRHFHNEESLALYADALMAGFQKNVLRFFENFPVRMLFLTPSLEAAPNSSLVYMFETVRKVFGDSGSAFLGKINKRIEWTLDFDKTLSVLESAVSHDRPVLILGTAFNFVHLIDYLAERNKRISLPNGSRVLETGGYKGRSRSLSKEELHHAISKYFEIPTSAIIREYGMCELSSQAYATPRPSTGTSEFFQFPHWARARIVSPETGDEVGVGETGLIRIFDPANACSVMAIQTEDLGIRRETGFELLGRAGIAEPRGCSLMSP